MHLYVASIAVLSEEGHGGFKEDELHLDRLVHHKPTFFDNIIVCLEWVL